MSSRWLKDRETFRSQKVHLATPRSFVWPHSTTVRYFIPKPYKAKVTSSHRTLRVCVFLNLLWNYGIPLQPKGRGSLCTKGGSKATPESQGNWESWRWPSLSVLPNFHLPGGVLLYSGWMSPHATVLRKPALFPWPSWQPRVDCLFRSACFTSPVWLSIFQGHRQRLAGLWIATVPGIVPVTNTVIYW